jgi:hypothetical protein
VLVVGLAPTYPFGFKTLNLARMLISPHERKMDAATGYAPVPADSESVLLLLQHAAINGGKQRTCASTLSGQSVFETIPARLSGLFSKMADS